METALGWLGDIIRALLSFIPRLLIVRATHEGVKFAMGHRVVKITPHNGIRIPFIGRTGLHVYWPVVTEVEIVPIRRQTANLVPQYLETSDGQTVGVSGIVVYEVEDVVKLLTACWDYDDTIRDYALAAVKAVISQNTFKFFQEDPTSADKELTKQLRSDLRSIGVKVLRVTLSDFAQCIVLATWNAST